MQPEQQEIWKRHTQEMGTWAKYLQVPKPIGKKKKTNTEGQQQKTSRKPGSRILKENTTEPTRHHEKYRSRKTLARDHHDVKMKYFRMTKNRLQHNQRSRSLSRRRKNKEMPIRTTNQDNKNNIEKTEEVLRTQEPQVHTK